jgi:hypothetical protein
MHIGRSAQGGALFGRQIVLVADALPIGKRVAESHGWEAMAVAGRFAALVIVNAVEISAQTTVRAAGGEHCVGTEEAGENDFFFPMKCNAVVERVNEHE